MTKRGGPSGHTSSRRGVELPGIEPGSGDAFRVLLRAQSAMDFLGPRTRADTFADRPSHLSVPAAPMTRATSSGFLDDAGYWDGSGSQADGVRARSGGEGELVARVIGNYVFAGIVYEISLRPRPASPRSTTTVETDQPLCCCQLPRPGQARAEHLQSR